MELKHLLRNREVMVVGERDGNAERRPGLEGALRLAQTLADAWGRPVRRVLPPYGAKDIRDWVKGRDLRPDSEEGWSDAGEELLKDLNARSALVEPEIHLAADWHRPYPTELLPGALRDLVEQGGRSIACDPVMIAVPALISCSGAIGLSARVKIKGDWDEPSVLWGAVVAPSGAKKDPALDLAVKPLRELDHEGRIASKEKLETFNAQMARFKFKHDKWAKGSSETSAPQEPSRPRRDRVVIDDATFEAVTRMLADSRGASLVSVRGELAAWFKEWGEYSPGRTSSHSSKWLGLHGARFSPVDRVGAGEVFVPAAAVSLVGMIQPDVLQGLMTKDHLASGLFARVLWALPQVKASFYTDECVDPAVTERYAETVKRLRGFLPEAAAGESAAAGTRIPLSRTADAVFRDWYDELVMLRPMLPEAERSVLAKLEGGAARFALVLALVKCVEREEVNLPPEVDVECMIAGVALARWHVTEARRVLGVITGDNTGGTTLGSNEMDDVIAFVARAGPVHARDVAKNFARFRGLGGGKKAVGALDDLCAMDGPLEKIARPRSPLYQVRTRSPDSGAAQV